MDYKYDELAYAEMIYKYGFQRNDHLPTELRLVAIYMRRILNYKPKLLRQEFYNWCSLNITNYNPAIHYKIVNRAINQATKKGSGLIHLDHVEIYQSELQYIENIINPKKHLIPEKRWYDCQKLIFTLAVQLKINKFISASKNTAVVTAYKGIYF